MDPKSLIRELENLPADYAEFGGKLSEVYQMFIDCINKCVASGSLSLFKSEFSEFIYSYFSRLDPKKIELCFLEYENNLLENLDKLFLQEEIQHRRYPVDAIYLCYNPGLYYVSSVLCGCSEYSQYNHDWIGGFYHDTGQIEVAEELLCWNDLGLEFDAYSKDHEIARLFVYMMVLWASCRAIKNSKYCEFPFSFSCHDSPCDIIDISYRSRINLI
ncbi:hypothetical protein HCH_00607 [Hahella chejuensis KCTC 2396]|uniref:Uncharacterized protein n=1 Tax=Hahella chejuensis (strain KCTC 2396) TaxID=349521 RepID=Q2SPB4_HAHCH|nr:hypothetical protein [Hahella chejuensis]ABC27510.1 hypothetical protein HCH_00607 [Hahella chejuensis KCTC 2396]